MSIQQVRCGDSGGKLYVEWIDLDPTTTARLSIQISTHSNFSENYQHFLLPNLPGIQSVSLAVASGPWYCRVGAWKLTQIDVEWSGIYGPFSVSTQRQTTVKKGKMKLIHTQAIDGGVRIHTGLNTGACALVEYTEESIFSIHKMKYRFLKDTQFTGYYDVLGFNPMLSYSIRIAECKEPVNSVEEPMEWLVLKGQKALPPRKHKYSAEHTLHKAEALLLQEARTRPMRFSSGADYANFLAAQAKAKGTLR